MTLESAAPTENPSAPPTAARTWLRRWGPTILDRIVQLMLIRFVYDIYRGLRTAGGDDAGTATDHARQIWDLERWLGMPDEEHLQDLIIRFPDLIRAINVYYVQLHWTLLQLFLVWLVIFHRDAWPRLRTVFLGVLPIALVIHLGYPLAPPRFMSFSGMIDTMVVYGPSSYEGPPGTTSANQFAAMPSLHCGWTMVVAWAVIAYAKPAWRYLILLYPLSMVCTVVATGNHYWMDGIIGGLVVASPILLTRLHKPYLDVVHRHQEWRSGIADARWPVNQPDEDSDAIGIPGIRG